MLAQIERNSTVSLIKRTTLRWEIPVLFSVFYVLWVLKTNKTIQRKKKNSERETNNRASNKASNQIKNTQRKRRSNSLNAVMFLHNIGMSLFSIVVFMHTFSVILNGYISKSFNDFILDPGQEMWKDLSVWVWLFYISKYYEIMDTWILFASGKECTFLQMYHHAGAIVACWLVCKAETYSGWIWIVLNSFIHSIMYSYYAMTVFGIRPPFKRIVTLLQIGQFISGFVFGFTYIFYPGTFSSKNPAANYQYAAIAFNIVYVSILTYLFFKFEKETYRSKISEKSKRKTTKRVLRVSKDSEENRKNITTSIPSQALAATS